MTCAMENCEFLDSLRLFKSFIRVKFPKLSKAHPKSYDLNLFPKKDYSKK